MFRCPEPAPALMFGLPMLVQQHGGVQGTGTPAGGGAYKSPAHAQTAHNCRQLAAHGIIGKFLREKRTVRLQIATGRFFFSI